MMTAVAVRRLIPLTLGHERMPKSASVHGDTSGEVLTLPVGAALLDTDDGWTLIDTGFHPGVRDMTFDGDYRPLVPEGAPLLEIVAELHLSRVYLSHLDLDHAGGLRLLPRVPVFVQRAELAFGLGPDAEANAMIPADFDSPDIDWRLLDGDTDLADGVRAISTPGHTPGHQSFAIDLPGGTIVLAADACDLTESLEREVGPGTFVGDDPEPARQSLLRLKRLGHEVVPWHDPVAWPAFVERMSRG